MYIFVYLQFLKIRVQPVTYMLDVAPLPVTVANKGLKGFPTRNVIFLVVTVTGRRLHPTYIFGQIITTSAEVTLNGGLIRELPQNPLNLSLGIILICPDIYIYIHVFSGFLSFKAICSWTYLQSQSCQHP